MAMKKKFGFRLAAILTAATLFSGAVPAYRAAAQEDAAQETDAKDLLSIVYETISYREYLDAHKGAAYPEGQIRIEGGAYQSADAGFTSKSGYEGFSGNVALTAEEGEICWEVDVLDAGFYQIKLFSDGGQGQHD